MNKEATMAKIGNVFSQKLHSSSGITEDDGLVDCKLFDEKFSLP
jgi:hypothetical protein